MKQLISNTKETKKSSTSNTLIKKVYRYVEKVWEEVYTNP